MPLVLRKRVELPHDPGAWIDIHKPPYKVLMECQKGEEFDHLFLVKSCIDGWSYEEECTPENIDLLQAETVTLLSTELLWRDTKEEEKKEPKRSTKR